MSEEKTVVIVGGGFAGINAAKKLGNKKGVRVKLLDQRNHHLFQPLLYQVALAALSPAEIATPIRTVLSPYRNVEVYLTNVEGVDFNTKEVQTDNGIFEYDYLILACGANHSYFGNDHWERHAPGLKTLHDALRIRRRVLTAFEQAETTLDTAEQERLMTIVVVGGGPTGVELAVAMCELVQKVFHRDFRRIDVRTARVILIESNKRLLKVYPEELSASAKQQLEELGVEVRLGVRVSNVEATHVDLNDGTSIQSRNVLWGAGVGASPLTAAFADTAELDRGGRIKVMPDLSVPGHPDVFAVGDLVNMTAPDGQPVPGVAPAAMQMGKHVAKLIEQEYKTGTKPPDQREAFRYWDKGSMATIGRKRAVAMVGRFKISGFFAWLAWLGIHLMFLVSFRNKVSVLIQWMYSYLAFRRGARIIIPKNDDQPEVAGARD